jgi:proline iminopeptidase
MKRKVFRLIRYSLLFSIGIFLIFIFFPRAYHVPQMQKRESTRYWTLPTGSRIGYTLVSAKGVRKPYPIIFLQGGPGGFISDRNIEMLAPLSEDGYDVYLYDQIGSGHSNRLENIEEYTTDRHKRDLEEIVKKTGAEKVILIGQSWGSILATLFITDNPGKVEKLIVTGPGPILPVLGELASMEAPDSLHLKEPPYSNRQANEKTNTLRSNVISLWAKIFGRKLASDKEADDFQTCLNNELNKATVCDTSKALKAEGG